MQSALIGIAAIGMIRFRRGLPRKAIIRLRERCAFINRSLRPLRSVTERALEHGFGPLFVVLRPCRNYLPQ